MTNVRWYMEQLTQPTSPIDPSTISRWDMPPPPPHADPGSGVDEGMHPVGFVPGPVPGSVPGPASGSGPGPGPGPGSEILDQNRPLARYLVAQLDGCKERLMVVEPRTGAGGGRGEPRGGGARKKQLQQ